jgi:hypothetical protein
MVKRRAILRAAAVVASAGEQLERGIAASNPRGRRRRPISMVSIGASRFEVAPKAAWQHPPAGQLLPADRIAGLATTSSPAMLPSGRAQPEWLAPAHLRALRGPAHAALTSSRNPQLTGHRAKVISPRHSAGRGFRHRVLGRCEQNRSAVHPSGCALSYSHGRCFRLTAEGRDRSRDRAIQGKAT